MELHRTAHGWNLMFQQMGTWKYRNGNARRSARAVVQEHNVFRAHISYDRRACSHGRRGFFGFKPNVLEHAGHFRLLYKWGWVRVSSIRDGAWGG